MKVRLTERMVESLKTARKQEDFFHIPTPSAGLRVTREGRKTWFAIYRSAVEVDSQGQPKLRRYCFGEHRSGKAGAGRYLTLEEFRCAYEIFRGQLAQGLDPKEAPPAADPSTLEADSGAGSARSRRSALPKPKAVPMLPVVEVPEWLQSLFPEGYPEGSFAHRFCLYLNAAKTGAGTRKLAPRTLQGVIWAVRFHVLKAWGFRQATSITQDCVSDLLAQVASTSPGMVRIVKNAISAMYGYCRANVREMRRFVNPALGAEVTVPKRRRDRYLTDEEMRRLLDSLPSLSDSKARDIYTLILASGCRPGEAAGVRAEDVVTLGGERVWRVRYKVDRDHLIPLEGPIGDIINRRLVECGGKGPLFWASLDRTKEYPEPLKRANKQLRALASLENFRPHDLRRTMRTHIESLGVRPEVGEALLNHQKGDLERTYALYTYWKERKEALCLWHGKLASMREPLQVAAA